MSRQVTLKVQRRGVAFFYKKVYTIIQRRRVAFYFNTYRKHCSRVSFGLPGYSEYTTECPLINLTFCKLPKIHFNLNQQFLLLPLVI